jgi:hypothetical protein
LQLLASKVEKCWTRWTGLPVDLGRFEALWNYWGSLRSLPSLHDLEEWGFESAWVNDFQSAESLERYRNKGGKEIGVVDVEKWGREWWALGPNSNSTLADLGGEEMKWWGLEGGVVVEADGDEVAERIATVRVEEGTGGRLECGDGDNEAEQCIKV